jgi:tetratricopeptide (TPR) repeat protein
LVEPLDQIARILADSTSCESVVIAAACDQIRKWAEDADLPNTALAFAQAAALADMENARWAYEVGRLARIHAEYARAESWLRQAIVRARKTEDWSSYSLAHIGLGNVFIQRGAYPAARRAHTRAYRTAKRHGLRRPMAMAAHDLMVVAITAGTLPEAEQYAAAAAAAYGPQHPRLPYLTADMALLWMENGFFSRALEALRAVLPHVTGFPDRLLVLAMTVRAAGATGARDIYAAALGEALEFLGKDTVRGGVSPTLLNLAYGAASAGESERAADFAKRAVALATDTGEAEVLLKAEAVLNSVRTGKADIDSRDQLGGANSSAAGDSIARQLVQSLTPMPETSPA